MASSLALRIRSGVAASSRRHGITLLEVLAAIFIIGIGLLALLTLFPIGALQMAQAIKDDRAGQAAADAVAWSEAGKELLGRTREFVLVSARNGSTDPTIVASLQADYGDLSEQAAVVEAELRDVRPLATTPRARLLVDRLLLQIRAIKLSLDAMGQLLQLLGGSIPTD